MAEQQTTARPPTRDGSDYSQLLRQVRGAGLLERRRSNYLVKISVTGALLLVGVAAFVLLGNTWWQVITAAYLSVVFTQIGFVGHDAGHHQIFRRRQANRIVGLLHANLLIGLSYDWWTDKHNRHHAHPNDSERDPDIGTKALVFTTEQSRTRRGAARLLARWQAWLFFPMLLLEGANLHLASIRSVSRRFTAGGLLEATLLLIHAAGYLVPLLVVLSPVKAAVFVAVQQGLFGLYLGCAFAPNHKGMPMLNQDEAADYLRRQVLTSRNVRGGPVTDWVLGGLNYQVEHHLFPSMPRANLSRAQPLVRAFCADRGIAYRQCGVIDSYAQAIKHLSAVGRVAGTA